MTGPLALTLALALAPAAHAEDWTTWGRTPARNMVAGKEKKLPKVFVPGKFVAGTEEVDLSTTDGVRWVAKLGSQSYGNPTVANGRVYVGTNYQFENRPGITGDHSVLKALSEDTGELLWQLTVPKMGSGRVNDWEYLGICSSPAVIDDVVYLVTTRGEVVALDAHGLANGNDGMQDEGAYMANPGQPALDVLPMDADLLWVYDMPAELGVFPHNASSSSPLIIGDRLYVATSNGVDWSHIDLPSPFAPAAVVLDRHTGKLVGEEATGISERTLHANWSSLAWIPAVGATPAQVVFGAGDGFLYGFDEAPVPDGGLSVLKERWRVDTNPQPYWDYGNYPAYEGPSEVIATPVYAEGKVFVAIGQDPEHGPGVGALTAVSPNGSGQVQPLWVYTGITRTISTPAVAKGLVYAADYDGRLHCLDAATGEVVWVHDTKAHIWGSPLVLGNYVLLGDEDGILTVLKAGRKLQVIDEIALPAPIYSSPIVANGTIYVATQTHLYAVDGK